MVATDVASRGIGMIINPLHSLPSTPVPFNISMRDLSGALLRSSRALAAFAPMTLSRISCLTNLTTGPPWLCR